MSDGYRINAFESTHADMQQVYFVDKLEKPVQLKSPADNSREQYDACSGLLSQRPV
jgi:hypothetical protein